MSEIREARPSDLAVARPLWDALQRDHAERDDRYRLSDDAGQRWAADFREWTRSRMSRVWLALDAGTAVGLLTAHLYEPAALYEPSLLVHVSDLYVAPPARGTGVARALVDAARQWGRAEGARQLRAGVLATNTAGRAFWSQAGAADFSVTVTMDLERRES